MKKILLYTTICLALLYAIRELEYMGILKNKKGEFAKVREAFEDSNHFDILVVGSSRAEGEFYTPIIDSTTGLHSFNIGITGATLPLFVTELEAYLVHSQPPKYVVLNLDLHNFNNNPDTVYHFPRYFAYLDNPVLYEGLCERDKRFPYFRYLPFYSMPFFNARYLNVSLRGWFDKPGKYDADYINGFAPSIRNPDEDDLDSMKMDYYSSIPKPFVWEDLQRIQDICNEKGSKLIFVLAPIYHRWEEHVLNYQPLIAEFGQYAAKQNLPFINMSQNRMRFQKDFYTDPVHMTIGGAKLFSRDFSLQLMQYIGQ